MTLIYRCDQCEGTMPDKAPRYAVDFVEEEIEVQQRIDDGAEFEMSELKLLGAEAEFHFCSPSCLAEWAFGRGIEAAP